MASRSQSAHAEEAVTERRLKPIYDHLDHGDYKAALSLSEKLLKKHKDLHCARVLKALALLRLGKQEESESLTQTVVDLKPTDEPTLQALSVTYREMQKHDKVIEVYTHAVKYQPTEENYTQLFMALVRVGDFKRQQQTAMLLYKVAPKNPYYFWAVMSIVMQALHTDDTKLSQGMFLPLAEKMVEKMLKEGKIEADAEMNLYLLILDLMGKHKKALEVIESKAGSMFLMAAFPSPSERRTELLLKMEEWDKANAEYKNLLKENPDNWMYYKNYLTSAFKLKSLVWSPSETEGEETLDVDHTYEMVATFIQERIDTEDAKLTTQTEGPKEKPVRGPYLAKLEFIQRLKDEGVEDNIYPKDDVKDLVCHYFELFGDKPCCFSDLLNYLPLLTAEQNSIFLNTIKEQIGLPYGLSEDENISHPNSVKHLQRHIFSLQLSRYFGNHSTLTNEERLKFSEQLLVWYREGLKFGNNLLQTDLQYADTYLLLAVHLLLDVWNNTGDDAHYWRVIILLEIGLKQSPSSHQFKLLLMRLYCLAGAFGPVPELYEGLDIKHMQQDTLGYNAIKYVKSLGQFSSATSLFNATLRFFTAGHKDVTEYMIASYRFGSFLKIPEFLRFRKQIKHSIHYAQTTAERMLLEILLQSESEGKTLTSVVKGLEISPEKDITEWDKISDQRDLDVMASYCPPSKQLSSEDKLLSLEQEKSWLRIRNIILRSFGATIDLQTQGGVSASASLPPVTISTQENNKINTNGESQVGTTVLDKLLKEFEECLESVQKDPVTRRKFPIQGPPGPLTVDYLDGSHGIIMLTAFKIVKTLFELTSTSSDDERRSLQETFCSQCGTLTDSLSASLKRSRRSLIKEDQENRRVLDRQILPELAILTETTVYVVLLLGFCSKQLKMVKQRLNKKAKKKKTPVKALQPPYFVIFNSLLEESAQIANGLLLAVQDIDPVLLSMNLGSLKLSSVVIEHDDEYEEEEKAMWKGFEESYQESSKEISDLIKSKLEYLKTLRL